MMRFKMASSICLLLILLVGGFCRPSEGQSNAKARQTPFQFEPATKDSARFSDVVVSEGLPEGFAANDLTAELPKTLKSKWLGSFTYGDDRSRSVAVMIIDESPACQMFVDCNRDRVFQADEKFEATKTDSQPVTIWHVELDSEFVAAQNRNQHRSQEVQFRWDDAKSELRLATHGTMRGTTEFNGQACAARYEDRNANGRWFDSEDRLFVDLNHDGRIDSLMERLPCIGMRKISGRLIAIGGDPTGSVLKLTEVSDQGLIVPQLKFADSDFKVLSLNAVLVSDGGMQARIKSIDKPVEVPIGKWRPQQLRIEVSGGGETFSFAFVASGSRGEFTEIEADKSAELDLLGELKLSATNSVQSDRAKLTITITPMLTSESGLYLVQSKSGKNSGIAENRLIAISEGQGRRIGVGSSGFS